MATINNNTSEKAVQDDARLEHGEKNDITNEHIETSTSQEDSTASDSDLNNKYAVKGDNSDGKVVWNWKTRIAASCLVLLYVTSQLPLYFVGGTMQFIVDDIGGADVINWLPVAATLAVAATCPFMGYLQDLMGRRNITLIGCALLLIGTGLVGGAKNFGMAVSGMAISGAGAGICELTALAGVAEIVPVNKRGIFLGVVTAGILPFAPYVMYGQYFSTYSTWRWGMWITLVFTGIAFVGVALTYFPKRIRPMNMTKMDILRQIDYVGAFLSIVGLTIFLVALNSGGYTHKWTSAYVMCTLLIGLFLIICFVIWEWKFAPNPMIPGAIFAGQRIVGLAFSIAFISGMNFYSILNFFPIVYSDLFEPTPFAIGTKALGPAFGVCAGAILVNFALSWFKDWNRELLLGSCVLMTVFGGALAAVTPETPGIAVAFATIGGFGIGGVLVPAATIAVTVTPDAFIATTVALSLAIRVIGGTIGFSIYYNVFKNKLVPKLPVYTAEAVLKAGLPTSHATEFVYKWFLVSPEAAANVTGATPEVIHAAVMASRWAYADSLAYVWYVSIAFGAISIIACCFLGNVRPYLTHRVAVQLGH